jgi:RimJ/RimL family protein N-acetyltransferase
MVIQEALKIPVIRAIVPAEVGEYYPLRMRALREQPEAFSSAYEEQAGLTLETFARTYLEEPTPERFLLGAWLDGVLVGTLGFFRASRQKTRHHAELGRMYVAPEARRQGVGWALLQAVLERARLLPGLEQISLGVTATNQGAIALYRKAGFIRTGSTPRYLKLDRRYYDMDQMMLSLHRDVD